MGASSVSTSSFIAGAYNISWSCPSYSGPIAKSCTAWVLHFLFPCCIQIYRILVGLAGAVNQELAFQFISANKICDA